MKRKLTFLCALTLVFARHAQDTDGSNKLLFIGVDGVCSDALRILWVISSCFSTGMNPGFLGC